MRSIDDLNTVRSLIAAGLNDCAISRQTGIPRRTVCDWRHDRRTTMPRDSCRSHDFNTLPSDAYSYLLGMYLGDGYISRCRSVWRLRVTLDKKYPGIIESCCDAIDKIMLGQHATVFPGKPVASTCRSSPNTCPACSPDTGRGKNTSARSSWNPGSKPTSKPPPSTLSAASSIATAAGWWPMTAGSPAFVITSPITRRISASCAARPWTASASPGPRTAAT